MAFRVEIAPRALLDIEGAYFYIRKKSPDRAARWFIGILDAIYSLEKMPSRCAIASESEAIGQEIRLLLHGKSHQAYKIFFSTHPNESRRQTVRVFHVRHGAQKAL